MEAKDKIEDEEKKAAMNEDAPGKITSTFPHYVKWLLFASFGMQGEGPLPAQVSWSVQEPSERGWRGQVEAMLVGQEQELEQALHGRQHRGQAQACERLDLDGCGVWAI